MSVNIIIFVELLAYLFCLANLFGKKFKLSFHAVILILLDLFLLTGINQFGFPQYLIILLYLGMFLYGLLYYQCDIKTTMVNCVFGAVLVSIFQAIIYLPIFFLFILKFGPKNEYEILINIGCLFVIAVLGPKMKLKSISDFFVQRNILLISVGIFIFLILGINLYREHTIQSISNESYILMVYALVFFIFIIGEWQKSRMDAEKKKAQLEMNKLYYNAYDQLLMLVRDRQHDMKNHISAILSMIHTTNNYEELVAKQQEYCGYVIKQNEETKLLLSSENPLITGFLYSKVQEAEKRGISVEYKIEVKKEMDFPEYELVEIIGILFDNAVEVLEKDEMLEKKIYVSLKEKAAELSLIVTNASVKYEGDAIDRFFEKGYSSKGQNRGIGLSKLKRMVNERKGQIIVSNEQYQNSNYLQFEIRIPENK